MTRSRSLLPATIGALIVLAFVAVVGRPSVFTDTRDYMIHGARFYQALRRTVLNQPDKVPRTAEEQRAWQRLQWQMHFDHSNTGARSPYYGIFLYSLAHRGTLWLLSAVQALACAWLLHLLWRFMAPRAPGWTYYTLMAALALGTALPWIASFAVPDVFVAVMLMAAMLILLYRSQMAPWEMGAVAILLGLSIVFHSSHGVLLLMLVPVGLVLGRLLKAPAVDLKAFAAICIGAIVVSMAASSLYAAAIKWKTGDELRRPPFLMARVLADGPGLKYLRHSCGQGAKWVICRFKSQAMDTSDHILWSADPGIGVFNRSSYEERVGMEKQEMAFVLATVAYDPVGQFAAAMKNWGEQLFSVYVEDPLRRPLVFIVHSYWGHTNLVGLLRGVGECGKWGEACEPKLNIVQLSAVDDRVLVLSLAVFGWCLFRRQAAPAIWKGGFNWDEPVSRAAAAALFLAAGIILNAAVCGVFSSPFPRYQSRIVWMLPAGALLMAFALVPETVWSRLRRPSIGSGRDALDALWGQWGPVLAGVQRRAVSLARERVDPAFLRYVVVGGTGFAIDGALLHLLTGALGFNYFTGRLVSFSCAVACTWLLNRFWTFKTAGSGGRLREAALYVGVQCAGGAANIAVYTLAVMSVPALRHWLIIPLAMGSAVGLCLTFLGAKHLAFRTRRGPMPQNGAVADISGI
jgi:putative flippase GtrA